MPTKSRVLIVDDDPDALRLIEYIFDRAGYEAHLAANGPAALSKVNEVKPDLLKGEIYGREYHHPKIARRANPG